MIRYECKKSRAYSFANLEGDIVNEGSVSNSTLSEDATLEGGTITGDMSSDGIIRDANFVGHKLVLCQLSFVG